MSNPIPIGILLLITMWLPGQALPAAPEALSNEAVEGDVALEKAIRDRLANSAISPDGIQVRVRQGVAILDGTTGVTQHKGTATRLARSAGATKIDNRIRVSTAARQESTRRRRSQPRRVRVRRPENRPAQ